MDWGWPQWVIAVIYALTIVGHAANHEKPKTGEYNVLYAILSVSIGAFVLHKGGFW